MAQKQWNQSVASQWGLFLPPARPSLSELVVFETYLLRAKKRARSFRSAILGSTPEYRDLCQTYGADYCCIDYRQDNFVALRDFLLHKDTQNRLIVSDWRNMRFPERFDFFMGDLVTTVTSVQDHEAVFRNIRAHCRPEAVVMLKVPLRSTNRRLSHQEIFRRYRERLSHLNPFSAVWHEVLLADYDFTEDTMHCGTSLKSLRRSFRRGILTPYEFGEFKKRWDALGDFKMNIPLKRKYLRTVSRYFTVERVTSGDDWYRRWSPILILRPRKRLSY